MSIETKLYYLNGKAGGDGYWKVYQAEMAAAVYGEDRAAGDHFLETTDFRKKEAALLASELSSQNRMDRQKILDAFWTAQIHTALSLIEEERCCYIAAQYGRLEGVLGVDYWDADAEEYRVLWNYGKSALINEEKHDAIECQGAPITDPYELDVETLHHLGYFQKRLVMLGTYSFTPFFSMTESDRERFDVLAAVAGKLSHHVAAKASDFAKLLDGHDAFMDR